jgi:hypothetical protein
MTSIGFQAGLEEYLKYIKRAFPELTEAEQIALAEKDYKEHVLKLYGYSPGA